MKKFDKNKSSKTNKDFNDPTSEEFKPKVNWFDRIPYAVKALVLKYWFFGMIYFFFVMGIPNLDMTSETVIVGVALGILNDLVIYKILELFDSYKNESQYYKFFRSKKVYSIFINTVYGFIVGGLSMIFSFVFRYWIQNGTSLEVFDTIKWLFAEPFTFALLALFVDAIFIGIKDLCVYLYRKHISKKEENENYEI